MTKKLIILSELLVLFLVIGSSIAMAYTGFSGENKSSDIHKNSINQTEVPKFSPSPVNPKFIEFRNNTKLNLIAQAPYGHGKGHSPSPIDFSYLKNIPSTGLQLVSIPASYDLRTQNKVTSVKDQGSTDTCFIFATYGSLESYLMPGQNYYFSEQNPMNLLAAANGFDWVPRTDGGSSTETTAFLARWSGPVNNSDDPWNPSINTSPTGLPRQKHVQNVIFLPQRANATDNQAIKQAIMNYGGVDCPMFYDETSAINETMTYNSVTHSYYLPYIPAEENHDITLMGWNDNYSASNFSTTPPGNGAFIVKNSWGTSYGDNGYFYISYYDKALAMLDISAAFTGESPNDYQNIYQHDPLGWCLNYGTGTSDTIFGASVFTAQSNKILKAISFYSPTPNTSYVIKIYTNTGSNPPLGTSGPVVTQSGTISTPGYVTVPLTSGANLTASQTFSVVIQLITPGLDYPLPASTPISGYSSNATATAGESYLSSTGSAWTDLTSVAANTTLNIKAFTNSTTAAQTPIITWSNPANITYGTALSNTQLNATASNPTTRLSVAGTFVYTPPSGTILGIGSNQKLNTTFTPTDTANYTTASKSVSINVTAVQNPALTLVKLASPTTYSNIGQNITYTYNVTNSGNVNLTGNITVKDNMTGTFNITSSGLKVGNSVAQTANHTITQADLNASSVTNLANATGLYNNILVTSANTSAKVTKSSALNIAFSIPTSNLVAGQSATGTTTYTVTPA